MTQAKPKVDSEQVFRQYLDGLIKRPGWKKQAGAFHPGIWFRDHYRPGRAQAGEPRMEPKQCVQNALRMAVEEGMHYVEGFVLAPVPIRHAWNQDTEGSWWDFTLEDAENHPYFGVEIPKEIVTRTAMTEQWELATGVLETLGMLPPRKREALILEASPRNFLPCVMGGGKHLHKKRMPVRACTLRCEKRAMCQAYTQLLESVMGA